MELQTVKTPSLVLDVERVRSNARRISDIAIRNSVRLRPHIKTHKCVEVARMQTEVHNAAVTVSTLAEARAFAKQGFNDFTHAVPIEPGKFGEVVEIVRSGVSLNVITDDVATPTLLNDFARQAGVDVSVFMEVDCGDHRSGVNPGSESAVQIAKNIVEASNLTFAGILTHAGHSYNFDSIDEVRRIAREERDIVVELAGRLRSDGVDVPTVSIGSTPTINNIDHLDGVDEVRPGNYIFFDAFQATIGSCSFDDCALTILAAVTHRSLEQKKIIVDAGGIALSKDRGPVAFDKTCGYGRVYDIEGNELGLRVSGVSQEHGVIMVEDDALLDRLTVGTRVRILANHSCMSAAQHTHYNVLENGSLVDRWEIHRGW